MGMPWNVPQTWSSSQFVDATDLEDDIRENLEALYFQMAFQNEDVICNQVAVNQDLPGLRFRVKDGETWCWSAQIYFVTNTSADIAMSASAPPNSSGRFGAIGNGIPIVGGASFSTFGDTAELAISTTLPEVLTFGGVVIAGGDGFLQVRGCQATAASVDTTFYQDSWMVAFRVAA